jgi:outer membrane protein OmpA-like peptidoglycan-associated protein
MLRRCSVVLLGVVMAAFGACAAGQMNQTTKGTLAGGALGAGLGAIVGNAAHHHAGAGVAIGTAAGALGGALIGNSFDQEDQANQQLAGQIRSNQEQLDENRRLIDELRRRGADVRNTKRGVVINLPDILFDFDRATLTPEAHRTLDEISDVLRTVHDRDIAVEGHTDSIGTTTYNKDLSLRRAESVAGDLSGNGIPRSQMTIRGYGEGSPIATNNTAAGRARNRRVEVIVEN